MSLIYHYTSGINGGTTTNTPWDTGRAGVFAIAQPTTRQEVWDAIVNAFTGVSGAGWTSVGGSGNDQRFQSAGESTNDFLNVRGRFDGRYGQLAVGIKVDASGALEGGTDGSTLSSTNAIDLGTIDYTYDMQIVASLDYIWVQVQRAGGVGSVYTLFAGNTTPFAYSSSVLNSSGAAAAGEFVSISTVENPIVNGFRVGDQVQIVETAAASTPQAETFIISGLTTSSVEARLLQNSFTSGCRIGAAPCPAVEGSWSNTEPFTTPGLMRWRVPLVPGRLNNPSGDLAGNNSLPNGFTELRLNPLSGISDHEGGGVERGYGNSASAAARANRFTCRSMVLSAAGATGTFSASHFSGPLVAPGHLGVVPGILMYPGSVTFYTPRHDNFVHNRDSTTTFDDYVPIRFTSASLDNYLIGPTPP